jgi:hypothetical protein
MVNNYRHRHGCKHQRCFITPGPMQYRCMECQVFVGEHHARAMMYETRPPLWEYTENPDLWATTLPSGVVVRTGKWYDRLRRVIAVYRPEYRN